MTTRSSMPLHKSDGVVGDSPSSLTPPSSSNMSSTKKSLTRPNTNRHQHHHRSSSSSSRALQVALVVAVLYATLADTLRRNVAHMVAVTSILGDDLSPVPPVRHAVHTWSDTHEGQVCHQMYNWKIQDEYLSFGISWDRLRPALLNASFYPPQFANSTRFRQWIAHLFDYYTHERLQRSQAHPAPRPTVQQLWKIIQRRLDDPANNEPVRIAVFGGSVTTGRDCQQNPVNLPGTAEEDQTHKWCAYPHLLGVMLDRTLFPNRSDHDRTHYPVFEVTNMAVQATNSEVGAMALEYNLLPQLEQYPPHIVVSSYSANDAEDDEQSTFWTHQRSFVTAAHNLHPCNDHLPLVVMADDWLGHGLFITPGLVNTGSLYKTAAWHNVMAVLYTNVIRSEAIYHSNFTDAKTHPLFGSKRWSMSHLGFGFHVGHAWTLFFNLLGALHDACAEVVQPNPTTSSTSLSEFPSLAAPLPTKYMGKYDWAGPQVLRDWDVNYQFKTRLCGTNPNETTVVRRPPPPAAAAIPKQEEDEKDDDQDSPPPTYRTSNCEYAWMVNFMTNVWTGWDVQLAMNHVLVDEPIGWDIVDRTPKSGWAANRTVSHLPENVRPQFTIEVRNISQPVDTFTILSLKSYGPEWAESELYVDVSILPRPSGAKRRRVIKPRSVVQAYVAGNHDKKISVAYPHKFRLTDNDDEEDSGEGHAQVGDTIRATFALTGGTNFKISGLAFCRSLARTSS